MRRFSSVEDFLDAQRSQRPVSYREIVLSVEKAEPGVNRELNRLVRLGEVFVVKVRFQRRIVPFYSLREQRAEVLVARGNANRINTSSAVRGGNGSSGGDGQPAARGAEGARRGAGGAKGAAGGGSRRGAIGSCGVDVYFF